MAGDIVKDLGAWIGPVGPGTLMVVPRAILEKAKAEIEALRDRVAEDAYALSNRQLEVEAWMEQYQRLCKTVTASEKGRENANDEADCLRRTADTFDPDAFRQDAQRAAVDLAAPAVTGSKPNLVVDRKMAPPPPGLIGLMEMAYQLERLRWATDRADVGGSNG